MSKSILAYAAHVGKPGEWLDWVDGVLFAENMHKQLGFINYNARRPGSAPLQIEHANASLQEIPGLESGVREAFQRTEDSWCLLACNASCDKQGNANHWLPCVCKENVSESTYAELVFQQIAHLKVTIAQRQSDLLDVELEDDAEMSAQLTASLNEDIFS